MDKAEIEKVLLEAVSKAANEEGWANLAQIGAHLRNNDIKYGKLIRFLHNYGHMLDIRQDDTVVPPAVYARLKELAD